MPSARRLNGAGWVDGVAWRGRPHHLLEAWQRLINSWASSIRCGVERAHATMQQWYGMELRPLSRAAPQRLPSPVRRRCHEHEVAFVLMERA